MLNIWYFLDLIINEANYSHNLFQPKNNKNKETNQSWTTIDKGKSSLVLEDKVYIRLTNINGTI